MGLLEGLPPLSLTHTHTSVVAITLSMDLYGSCDPNQSPVAPSASCPLSIRLTHNSFTHNSLTQHGAPCVPSYSYTPGPCEPRPPNPKP